MNLSYRVNQLKNLLLKLNSSEVKNWGLIYGLPRSGTSFLLQSFMQKSVAGIGDWEIHKLHTLMHHYEHSEHIEINTNTLLSDLRKNIIQNASPGGGSTFDLIVKEIDLDRGGFEFYSNLFGSEPSFKIFCYRSPSGWLPSAKKKFGIDDHEAYELYKRCLESYNSIGGEVIRYDQIALSGLQDHYQIDLDAFKANEESPLAGSSELDKLFSQFESRLTS